MKKTKKCRKYMNEHPAEKEMNNKAQRETVVHLSHRWSWKSQSALPGAQETSPLSCCWEESNYGTDRSRECYGNFYKNGKYIYPLTPRVYF